jgi:2-polyprenyl-6-methoxyphenol hydroxylase-like FAD-dependent oxidoreductase
VTGVEVRRGGSSEQVMADVVVDSLGRRSQAIEWLREQGAAIRAENRASQCAYYCRHYVQCSSAPEPPRRGTGASLDYLVFGTFFADAGTFSIALTSPEFETELLGRLHRPEGFDAVCRQIPALRVWLERSEPISRVLGGADLVNRWHHFPRFGKQPVLGFFPVGDAYMQTNPIYGRGCSSAFVQAHALGEALLRQREPGARATHYHRSVWRLLRPHFDFCVAADRGFLARARQVRGETLPWRERMVSQAYESAFLPALEESRWVAREWLRAQQMCEIASPWVALQLLVYLLFRWVLRGRSASPKLPAQVGPERGDMLASFD